MLETAILVLLPDESNSTAREKALLEWKRNRRLAVGKVLNDIDLGPERLRDVVENCVPGEKSR